MSWPFETWFLIAVRRFGFSPSEFWELPVRDWLCLMNGIQGRGFDRSAFENLMLSYPDEGDQDE